MKANMVLYTDALKKKGALNFFRWKIGWLLCMLFFVGSLNAQNTISLEVKPGSWVGSVTPAVLLDGGAAQIDLPQYQCQGASLSVLVDGVAYPLVQLGAAQFETSNGKTLTTVTGGNGELSLNVPGEFCDYQAGATSFTVYLEFRDGTVYYSSDPFPPFVNVTPVSLGLFETCPSQASASQAFTVSGGNLTADVEVQPLEGYEYSLDNVIFQNSLSITAVGGKVNQVVYVRLASGNAVGTTNGSIECSTLDATSSSYVNVMADVSTNINMSVTPQTITNLDYRQDEGFSVAQSFVVSGVCLTGDINITAPQYFEVSTAGASTGFASSATLSSAGGTVWVRLKSANAGSYNGEIEIENSTAGIVSPQSVSVSGTVSAYVCFGHPFVLTKSGTICAIDECKTVYEVNVTGLNAYYDTFELQEYSSTHTGSLTGSDLQLISLPAGVGFSNPAFTYGGSTVGNFTFYLNTRTTPYQVTTTEPVLTGYSKLELNADHTTIGSAGELVVLTADLCPAAGIHTYEWYENGVKIGETDQPNFNVNPTRNGDTYSVVVDGILTSNDVRILYWDACAGRIAITNTQDSYGTACAIDECYTIYEIKVQVSNMHYSFFKITDLVATGTPSFTGNLPNGARFDNDGIVYIANNNNGIQDLVFYLNTRDGQYTVSTTQPALGGYFKVDLLANQTTISSGDQVHFTATVCPSGDYTYEWYENGVKIDETTVPEWDIIPGKNGNKYTVVINGQSSNEERILFYEACDGVFTLDGWYGVSNFNICAVDACYAIYKMELNLQNDAHFAIMENGKAISNISLSGVSLMFEAGEDGSPAYRNTGGAKSFVYYLDTNVSPYVISATEPVPPTDPRAKIRAAGSISIPKCDPIPMLTASVCPDDNGPYTYQWYRDGVAIDPAENPTAITDALENEIPADNNTEYYAVASNGVDDPIQSNTIIITFAANPVLAGTAITGPAGFELNYYEHEITQGKEVTITAPEIAGISYTLQFRSLEVGSVWKDTTLVPTADGTNIAYKIIPTIGAEYRIKAVDAGGCIERYSAAYLVRVKYECNSQVGEAEVLFLEDFGYFENATTYVKNGVTYAGNVNGASVEYYWAPDPKASSSNTSDPDGFVRSHRYAIYDPNKYDWCPSKPGGKAYRIEDGYYAIVANPASGGCGNNDFWDGPDHSGNTNGGMLFINCTDAPSTIVYKRDINVQGCKGVKVLFSAYISNATVKGDTPVNVRLDIWNQSHTKLIYSISSGDVLKRSAGDPNMWANLSFKFDATEEEEDYILELTNNSPGGTNWGNDILLDDISVTVCYPRIDLTTSTGDIEVNSCTGADTVVVLKAVNDAIKEYIPDPHFLFQYTRATSPGVWLDLADDISGETIVKVDTLNMRLTRELFRGNTKVRLIVSPDEATINKIKDGTMPPPSCEAFYAVSDSFNVDFNFFEPGSLDTVICPGQVVSLSEEFPLPEGSFEWNLYRKNDLSKTPIITGRDSTALYSGFEDFMRNLTAEDVSESREYILAFETAICLYDGDAGAQITIDKKLNAGLGFTIDGHPAFNPASDSLRICSSDETAIIRISLIDDPKEAYEPWIWKVNGVEVTPANGTNVLNMKSIVDMGIYKGTLSVMASCHCTDIIEIPFRIYKMFDLDLTSDVPSNGLCLDEASKEVTLTATTVNSSEGEPTDYYWYIYDAVTSDYVELPGNPTIGTDANIKKVSISENGQYRYKVEARDGICHNTTGEAWDNINQTSFEAGKPMSIEMILPTTDTTICKGGDIEFKAVITNPRTGVPYNWSVNGVEDLAVTGDTYLLANIQVEGSVMVSVTDAICASAPLTDSRAYTLLGPVDAPEIVSVDPVCLTSGDDIVLALMSTVPGATEYTWYNASGSELSRGAANTTLTVKPSTLTAGDNLFTVVVAGCPGNTNSGSVVVKANGPISLDLLSNPAELSICATGDVPVNFTVNTANALGDEVYYWELLNTDGETVTDYGSTDLPEMQIDLAPGAGFIRVFVEDKICMNNEPESRLPFDIREPSKLKLDTPDGLSNICMDSKIDVTLELEIVSGDMNPTWIKWDDMTEEKIVFGTDHKITRKVEVLGEETYKVKVKNDVCGWSDEEEITISVTLKPAFELIAEPRVVEVGENVKLTAVITPDQYVDSYSWSNDQNTSWLPVTTSNEIPAYLLEDEGFVVFYVSTQIGNCALDALVEVEVIEPVPNIITPYNGNGKNDVFMGPKNGRDGYKVEIYNRYQQLIYEGDSGWDGRYRGQLAEPGTYFYRVFMKSGKVMKGTLEVAKF